MVPRVAAEQLHDASPPGHDRSQARQDEDAGRDDQHADHDQRHGGAAVLVGRHDAEHHPGISPAMPSTSMRRPDRDRRVRVELYAIKFFG
jgi:hypothetical protein